MKQIYLGWSFFSFLFILGINNTIAQSALTVTTDSINNITATTASGYVTLTNNGGDPNVTIGLCYSDNKNPTIADYPKESNPGVTYFSVNWFQLSPNTTYYVKAYAINATDTVYGVQMQFTTDTAKSPTVTTDSINNITATTAKVYGNTTYNGNDPNVTSGFCYSTSPNPTIDDSVVIRYFTDTGSFAATMSGLSPDSSYYVRAYAINFADTVYGSQLQFVMGNASAALITTDSIKNISATTAVVYGNITNNGNDPDVTGGFCYSTSPSPTITNDTTGSVSIDTGSFNTTLYGLIPNTIYYVITYAINAGGIAYGNQRQFTTGNATSPSVTTDSIEKITAITAVGYGNITNDGNDPNVMGGFCYSKSPSPTVADSLSENTAIDTGHFIVTLSGLSPDITYYVKAYAINAVDTTYGSQMQFTTKSITFATITTDSIINIAATTAVGYGNITNNGNDPSVTGGFCYGTSPNPTIKDSITGTASINTGSFHTTIDSVSPNTTYYIRAYATNAAGTVYGLQIKFITDSLFLPKVTTDSVSNIGASTAVGYETITNDGNDPNVTGGFYYSTSPISTPTIADSTTGTIFNGPGFFNTIFYSGINPGTTYYVRAYAINAAGIAYGNQLSFTTLPIAGITEYGSLKTALSLSPNPTNGLLTIDFVLEEENVTEINVVTILGANCLSLKPFSAVRGNNTVMLDLSGFADGIYLLQIKADGTVIATQKIVKTD